MLNKEELENIDLKSVKHNFYIESHCNKTKKSQLRKGLVREIIVSREGDLMTHMTEFWKSKIVRMSN